MQICITLYLDKKIVSVNWLVMLENVLSDLFLLCDIIIPRFNFNHYMDRFFLFFIHHEVIYSFQNVIGRERLGMHKYQFTLYLI